MMHAGLASHLDIKCSIATDCVWMVTWLCLNGDLIVFEWWLSSVLMGNFESNVQFIPTDCQAKTSFPGGKC